MRRLYLVRDFHAHGFTRDAIRWGEKKGRWTKVIDGFYGKGPHAPTPAERAVAAVMLTGGIASGRLAGRLHQLDSVEFGGLDMTLPPGKSAQRAGVRRRVLPPERITAVEGVRCTDGLQTMLDLAAELDDLKWEQALESALRKDLTTVDAVAKATIRRGAARVRRVLALRPPAAPATESLLETLMVQLIRRVPGAPEPTRQFVVYDRHGTFVARVDLCWPELGLFIELDGQQHEGQPVYDANRETAVVAATGWLCGRFTWTEVVHLWVPTARRLAELILQAQRRPLPV